MKSAKPQAIRLTIEEIETLTNLASSFGSKAKSSQNAGNPSWRVLVKDIASGKLIIERPGRN